MEDIENFCFDDDEFAKGAGIDKISEAYIRLFDNLIELSNKGKEYATGGVKKEFFAIANQVVAKAAALSDVMSHDTKIVGPTGATYNLFGTSDEDSDCDTVQMTEEEYANLLDDIINGCTKVSLTDANNQINKNNITDDGQSHGDLDDIHW